MGNIKDGTKVRIINAAKQLFINQGYKGTSTKQIALAAQVSEMTVFRHFPSKGHIFKLVAEPLVGFIDDIKNAEIKDPKELVRHLLEERLAYLREEHDLVRLVLTESYLTTSSINPIAETAKKIRAMLASTETTNADLYLRIVMGFILTCIFLPEECDDFPVQIEQLLELLV